MPWCRTGNEMWPASPEAPALCLGRSSRNCFQSLGNHWLRSPLCAPSWADENVPESLSYQWGRRPLLPGRKDSVCCSRLCSRKLSQQLPSPSACHPFPSPSPVLELSGGRIKEGTEGACWESLGGGAEEALQRHSWSCMATLGLAVAGEAGKHCSCSLTDGSAPGGRRWREAGWTSLPVTAATLHAHAVPATQHSGAHLPR